MAEQSILDGVRYRRLSLERKATMPSRRANRSLRTRWAIHLAVGADLWSQPDIGYLLFCTETIVEPINRN